MTGWLLKSWSAAHARVAAELNIVQIIRKRVRNLANYNSPKRWRTWCPNPLKWLEIHLKWKERFCRSGIPMRYCMTSQMGRTQAYRFFSTLRAPLSQFLLIYSTLQMQCRVHFSSRKNASSNNYYRFTKPPNLQFFYPQSSGCSDATRNIHCSTTFGLAEYFYETIKLTFRVLFFQGRLREWVLNGCAE